MARAAPLAMNNTHALDAPPFALVQKASHRLARDRHRHAVQIQFGADDEQAAAQFFQGALL